MVLPEGLIVKQADLGASQVFRVNEGISFDHSGQYTAVGRSDYAGPERLTPAGAAGAALCVLSDAVRVAASVLGAAALIAAPAAWPASSAPATCSRAAAQAGLRRRPRLALTGDKVLIGPDQADLVLCFDATGGDGRR